MNQKNADSLNVFEQISQICRDFRKQISEGRSPRIEKYLTAIPDDGRETLFSNLLEIEINFRQRKGLNPSTGEYVKRFPEYATQVRRAFFEPTMASMDSGGSGDKATQSLNNALGGSEHTLTFQIPDANRLGDYELMRELGRGGMGVVYEARHTKTNNRVALKTLPTGGRNQEVNADKLYRFRREFRRLSEINHPNLVGMQTLEVDGSQWFFTMDLIDGDDFLSYVRPDDKLDEKRLRSCIAQLARGVIALHRERIVHRDLKPSNVLVAPNGRVSILDFGLAAEMQKTADMTQTKSGLFAGTPRYAAPEQMFGDRTEASDWYAFGTMLYEALAGEPPFHGKDQVQLLRDKQSLEAPSLTEVADVPDDLAQIADGLIRREPDERLAAESVSELLQLNLDTRSSGSTAGSHVSSTGSVAGEELDLENLEEEDAVLIGREEQLAQLESIKDEFLKSRNPQVVWVTGLSGEGKSSLVQKFLRPIRKGEEMLVLSGRCYDRESVPFKVIDSYIDSLVRFLRARSDSELQEFLPEDIVALAKLFPVLRRIDVISHRDTRSIAGLDEKQIHNLAFVALNELLFNISQQFPIAIFVDDLQWGDADSAEAIFKQLVSEMPPQVLMLGSYRSDEMNESPFWKIWEQRIDSDAGSISNHSVEVQPLTVQQSVELLTVRTGLSPDVIHEQASELIKDAHGNPYFLEQLIEEFDHETGAFRAAPLNEIIGSKLRRLPSDAAALLKSISVAGKAVSLAEASEVSGIEVAAFGTVAHMRSERLVRLIGSYDNQFVDTYHDKIRETVLSELSEQEIRKLHLAYGEWIEKETSGTDSNQSVVHPRATDLAYHFVSANQSDKAFRYSLAAGQLAMTAFAFSDALRFLENARRQQLESIDVNDEFALRFLTGKALSGLGKLDESIMYLIESKKFARDPKDRFKADYALAESRYRKSDYAEAIEDFRNGFSELGEKLPRTSLGKVLGTVINLVSIHLIPRWVHRWFDRRPSETLTTLTAVFPKFAQNASHLDMFSLLYSMARSGSLAKIQDDKEAKALAYGYYSIMLQVSGVPIVPHRVMASVLKLNDSVTSTTGLGAYNYHLGCRLYFQGDLRECEEVLKRAAELLGRSDDYRQILAVHFLRHLWSHRGNANRIFQYALQEFELGKAMDDEISMAYGNYGFADAYSRQGEFKKGIECGQSAVDVLEKWNATFKSISYMELGRAQLQAGDFESARKSLGHSAKLVLKLRFFEISAGAFALHAESILGSHWALRPKSLSRRDLRIAGRSAFAARCSGWPFRNLRPHACRVTGRLFAAKGQQGRAQRFFAKAIDFAEKIGAEYELARSLIDKSMLNYPDARSDREKGLELLASLGCVLPDAEVEYLGIDRTEHHSNAATTGT